MAQLEAFQDRRTSADVVFDDLLEKIVSLTLLPGMKMSEVEIASQFGVSRQPVRDAFSKLESMGLLLIRPQKATVVRKFSSEAIMSARFTRVALETEVLRRGAASRNTDIDPLLLENLEAQRGAVKALDQDQFHDLDYQFHRLLCDSANCGFVFKGISECKAQVDRLCMLSISQEEGMAQLVTDHEKILEALMAGQEEALLEATRVHLDRLDSTILQIRETYGDYFED